MGEAANLRQLLSRKTRKESAKVFYEILVCLFACLLVCLLLAKVKHNWGVSYTNMVRSAGTENQKLRGCETRLCVR